MEPPCISILAPAVVNQIAAGEVVERPASVVKEVVENALDAGARRVDVAVENGGRKLIQVVDDGVGMTPREAQLSLERHATSKLRCLDDLESMRTMGFRGEALPSIASVSRMTMITRPEHLDQGHRLRLEAGRVLGAEPVGCRVGTQLQIVELFFNTPARLKFLKSTATEAAHISDTVTRLALTAPEVHFTLTQDGRRSLELPPCSNSLERARAVLGRQGKQLFSAQHAQSGVELDACLGPPQQTVRTARSITFTVNGRFIKDRPLVQAVLVGYGSLIDRGRFPVAVIHLALDPATMDVNVHPQKTEVRFREPRQIFGAVRRCVRDALAASTWVQDPAGRAPSRRYQVASQQPGEGYEEHKRRLREASRQLWSSPRGSAAWAGEEPLDYSATAPTNAAATDARAGFFSSLQVLGQLLGTYLVCEGDDELVLVDQHAAHERITYEKLKQAARGASVPSQRLLIPATVIMDPTREATARQRDEQLQQLGFDLEELSGNTWVVRALPLLLRQADPAELVQDVLDELAVSDRPETLSDARDAAMASMACHASVRAGQSLDDSEIRALLAALDRIDFSAACPHGRPVMVRLDRAELERRFGRN